MNLITGDLAFVIEKKKRDKIALGLENPIGSYFEKKIMKLLPKILVSSMLWLKICCSQ